MNTKKIKKHHSAVLDKILKEIPVETSLINLFQMEWLAMNIIPDREATDEENAKSYKWAKKMTKRVMESYKEWEKNGRPK